MIFEMLDKKKKKKKKKDICKFLLNLAIRLVQGHQWGVLTEEGLP